MQIVEKRLDEITPYENNPRKNDAAVEYVANSIREFEFKQPIVVDAGGVIIAGHTRYKAAKKLGLKTVPVVLADDLNEDQVNAYRLADNKVSEFAEWDLTALEQELANIELDMSEFGFDDSEEETPEESDSREVELTEEYQLIIDCVSETDMREKYEFLQEAGIECRVSTL